MLDPNELNYALYADGYEEEQQIRYYVKMAEELKQEEKQTLYVDYNHLASFNWEEPNFMDKLMAEYARFEPYLKKALTQFLADQGH